MEFPETEIPTLVVIAGPTAVGKTQFAIDLARQLETVILSCDSRQFYTELNIGTAKPSAEQLSQVLHYFIGHLSIHDYYSTSGYESDALAVLYKEFRKYPVIVMVGGSGLYIDAVCKGMDFFPDPDPELRSFLKGVFADEGIQRLQELLLKHDPDYYRQVDLANPNRILRALEVSIGTGKPYSKQRLNTNKKRDFRILRIGLDLPREELFSRIGLRVDDMMESGLWDEVVSLYPYRHLNALNTVGYKELFEVMDDKVLIDQAIQNIKTHTRRYAKRQLTWFRKDPEYRWFHPDQLPEVLELILTETRNY